MLGQLTEVMSMDDVQVLYPKERITLYGINSNCELFLPIARSSFPSYFPFCFCSLLLQRRAVAALLSPGEVHGVVLCIALVFLSFLRFLLYSVDWTSVGHSLRCGSLGLETSTLNSFVDAIGGYYSLHHHGGLVKHQSMIYDMGLVSTSCRYQLQFRRSGAAKTHLEKCYSKCGKS